MTFQEVAITSAQRYYQFLSDEGKGIIIRRVIKRDIEDGFIYLSLDGKLPYPEFVKVKIFNTVYTDSQIYCLEYDGKKRVLKVRPNDEFKSAIVNAPLEYVSVISDLRFLVERVRNWYMFHGANLQLPCVKPQINHRMLPILHDEPSEDQLQAISGALSSPFSYIWGAPGTGKTQLVLARCVLTYLQEEKPILLVAPTNNAVEQMLYGILSVLSEADYSLDQVLRLGRPSPEFRQSYPEVCVNTTIEKQLVIISEQIEKIEKELKNNEELLVQYAQLKQLKAKEIKLDDCSAKLFPLLTQLQILFQQQKEQTDLLAVLSGKHLLVERQLKEKEKERQASVNQIKALNNLVEKYDNGIRKLLLPGRANHYLQQLQNEMEVLAATESEIKRVKFDIEDILHHVENCNNIKQNISQNIQVCRDSINEVTAFWKELNSLACSVTECVDVSKIEQLINATKTRIQKEGNKYQRVQNISEAELVEHKESLIHDLEQHRHRQADIAEHSVQERIKRCKVIAATADTCLKDLPPNGSFKPSHVFLDEAGYCPLIKGVTLVAYNCPVTFLGDHMQLPPVCEMNDDQFALERNAPVSLWAQSALFTSEALTDTPANVINGYRIHAPASFRHMSKYDLVHTYRFGESLANVLASDVYSDSFHGDKNCKTNIYYIRASRNPDSPKRTSNSESLAITRYLQKKGDRDVGIITPYKAQRELLKAAFRHNKELAESVMTVHGSQGREWDVVLFSVVDTSNKWFTDSQSSVSNGKNVINTAVSRAKKKLILVCDVDYWQTQHNQLIGKLLSVAEEIIV